MPCKVVPGSFTMKLEGASSVIIGVLGTVYVQDYIAEPLAFVVVFFFYFYFL